MILIEILIIVVILTYAYVGFRRGFISQFLDLVALLMALFLALKFYNILAVLLNDLGLSNNLSKPVGFILLWIFIQVILAIIIHYILFHIPQETQNKNVNKYFGIIPGFIKGVVMVSIVLIMLLIVPYTVNLKDKLLKYPVSKFLILATTQLEGQVEKIFGNLNSLTSFSPVIQEEEMTTLDFKVTSYTIDETSEEMMLDLLNSDRAKAGLGPLKFDTTIREVARQHSIDMAQNGYFSHTDLGGSSPADRMLAGKVKFMICGENIALAPTYETAEVGFMNSPKHRDNILDGQYSRIGIGIIDLGIYGRMVTQNFAD